MNKQRTNPQRTNPRHRFDGKYGKAALGNSAKFGREVAIYNHGWLVGDDHGRRKGFIAGFERALLLMMGNGVKWTNAERRLGNRVTRKLFGKKRK